MGIISVIIEFIVSVIFTTMFSFLFLYPGALIIWFFFKPRKSLKLIINENLFICVLVGGLFLAFLYFIIYFVFIY